MGASKRACRGMVRRRVAESEKGSNVPYTSIVVAEESYLCLPVTDRMVRSIHPGARRTTRGVRQRGIRRRIRRGRVRICRRTAPRREGGGVLGGGADAAGTAGPVAPMFVQSPRASSRLDRCPKPRISCPPSCLSVATIGGNSMGSARDRDPDPTHASGSARPSWPPPARSRPPSILASVTPPPPPAGALARGTPRLASPVPVPPDVRPLPQHPTLLDRLAEARRARPSSPRTEQTYRHGGKRLRYSHVTAQVVQGSRFTVWRRGE